MAEIWAYLALEASEATASRLVADIKTDVDGLLNFPLSGAPRDQLARGLRMKPHGAYAIYYFADARALTVVRVLHGARDAVAIADRGGWGG